MKKCCVSFILGGIAGMAVAMMYEEELYNGMHCATKYHRRMMRKIARASK